MACGAGTAHFTGMFNFYAMTQQDAAEVIARCGRKGRALGTEVDMGENANGRHDKGEEN